MNPAGKRVLLTGASGGIGRHLALLLAAEGAELALVGPDASQLAVLADEIAARGGKACTIVADFSHVCAAQGVVDAARLKMGGVDVLINNAGVLDFIRFDQQAPERVAQMVQINLTVPMQLTRALLPDFIARDSGQIVNVGALFGTIGFPHFASYSATKFALHGFSQALRRELGGRNVSVTYVAPRAARTPLNDAVATAALQAGGLQLATPEQIAAGILRAMARGNCDSTLGRREAFLAWLNGIFPRVFDWLLKKRATRERAYVTRYPGSSG